MKNLRVIILSLMAVLLAACETDDFDREEPGYFLQLQVQVSDGGMGSRANGNPNGGETGDSNEAGSDNEGKVYSALLLLCEPKEGASASADISTEAEDVKVKHALFFKEFKPSGSTWTSEKVEFPKVPLGQTYHAIVIANTLAANPTDADIQTLRGYYEGQTLRQIRDKMHTDYPWTQSGETYDRFVMTSTGYDAVVFKDSGTKFSGKGTFNNPYIIGSFELERLAARIDISPALSGVQTNTAPGFGEDEIWNCYYATGYGADTDTPGGYNGYLFRVDSGDKGAGTTETNYDHFLLTGIEVVNIPKDTVGTYYLRRTVYYDAENREVREYLTPDVTGSNKASTKWVIGTKTELIQKNYAKENFSTQFAGSYTTKEWSTLPAPTNTTQLFTKNGRLFFTAAYTVENTFLSRNKTGSEYYTIDQLTQYATKIVFKGKYYKHTDTGYKQKEYGYVIRHSDPTGEGDITSPMLYGVVRNNIYRIAIQKVVGSDITMLQNVVWYYGSGTSGTIVHATESANISPVIGDKDDNDNGLTGGYPDDAPRRR